MREELALQRSLERADRLNRGDRGDRADRAERPRSGDLASSREIALFAISAALDKKALEPVLMEVAGTSSYTDFILVLSGRSDRHVQTVAEAVEQTYHAKYGRHALGMEGKSDGRWVLIDLGELVVHVFHHPLREHYDLEGLWSEAPRVPLEVPPDARIQHGEFY